MASGSDVRFVGGCVRDALLRKSVTDIDIGTPDTPEAVARLLTESNIKYYPSGISHGTVTVNLNHYSFEITTLRRDIKTDGRHASVIYTRSWLEDAKRRDFTVNTLSANLNGEIFDPLNIFSDLVNKKIKFVGNPEQRIKEDYLRILRYYRFNGLFEQQLTENEATRSCRKAAPFLKNLSGERVKSELFKILNVRDPSLISERMRKDRIFEIILPEAKNIPLLKEVSKIEENQTHKLNIKPNPIRRLASLIDPCLSPPTQLVSRFCLSKAQANHFLTICSNHDAITPDMDPIKEKIIFRKTSKNALIDSIMLQWGRENILTKSISLKREHLWLSFINRRLSWTPPTFPISGKDVIKHGISPGPDVGFFLSKVEIWWEGTGMKARRQQCLEQLKSYISKTKKDKISVFKK